MQVLKQQDYKSYLQPVSEPGIEESHIALLQVDDGKSTVRAYVKLYAPKSKSGKSTKGLVNEVVGYELAKACGLDVPSRAGLIRLDISQLRSVPHWIDEGQKDVVCWWSEAVNYPSIKANFNLNAIPQSSPVFNDVVEEIRTVLAKRDGVAKIIAFDDIVANIDRNLGNILDTPATLTLIDHGRILTGPAWVSSDLQITREYQNVIKSLLGNDLLSLPLKNGVAHEISELGKLISPVISDVMDSIQSFSAKLDLDSAQKFIKCRSQDRKIAAKLAGVVA